MCSLGCFACDCGTKYGLDMHPHGQKNMLSSNIERSPH